MNCQVCQGDGKVVRELWGFNRIREYEERCKNCGGSGKEQCVNCGNEDVREDLKLKNMKGYDLFFCSKDCMKEYMT